MAFRFFQFRVYRDAKELHRKIVFLTKKFPREFYYLKDQLRRSSLSIILSIAEGSATNSDRNFGRYIGIALGSGNETVAGIDVAAEENLITREEYQEVLQMCENVIKQLGAFSKRLKD